MRGRGNPYPALALSAEQAAAVTEAERALSSAVAAALAQPDLAAKRDALTRVWHRQHDLYELIKETEQRVRTAALASIEGEYA